MIKNKYKKYLTIFVVVIAGLFAVASFAPGKVVAAEPGCYKGISSGYVKVNCLDANIPSAQNAQNAVNSTPGECFVLGSTVLASGDTSLSYNNIDCSLITVNSYATITNDQNCSAKNLTENNCAIIEYLVRGINLLSAIAGIAIIGSIMIAGYQYMLAGGDPGKVQAARKRIVMAGTALLLFIFMYGLLNFLIPGGVL